MSRVNGMNQAKNEIKHQYLSAEKARRLLHWKPQYSLEEGLREAIQWYDKFLNLDRQKLALLKQ